MFGFDIERNIKLRVIAICYADTTKVNTELGWTAKQGVISNSTCQLSLQTL